jgi:hypothetical protein
MSKFVTFVEEDRSPFQLRCFSCGQLLPDRGLKCVQINLYFLRMHTHCFLMHTERVYSLWLRIPSGVIGPGSHSLPVEEDEYEQARQHALKYMYADE